MSVGPLCLAGWILVLFSKSLYSLILVRILHGLALGVVYTVTPIYTAEIAESRIRGRLVGMYQVIGSLGTIYSFSLGPYLEYDTFVFACLPLPIIFTIIWMFVPETPYYLLMTERVDKARKVLMYFRDGDVEEELEDMQKAVMEEMPKKKSWEILFSDKKEKKAFVIVQIVTITKFLTGIASIKSYTLEMFSRSGSCLPPEVMSILLASLLTVISFIAAFLSDWVGRKPLLLLSCFGCFVAHFLSGGYYYIHEKTAIDASNYIYILYIGLAMYCIFIEIGLGPLLQILQSEMFGTTTRGIAAGITEGLASLISLVTIKFYAPVNERYGAHVNFFFYSLVGLIGGVLLSFLMYETARKTIGQMETTPRNR
ncbi:unnamed protein product [Nezara viridula]|uniref:Major facilitator superfamily (MFS) profile domain-containing protein n=1 Tax=Nezara viridula TaxID=85310 RepID=A0A9P0H8R5_NEZVI|nr:unnamed protein product [Nezara viridula]